MLILFTHKTGLAYCLVYISKFYFFALWARRVPPSFPARLSTRPAFFNTEISLCTITGLRPILPVIHSEVSKSPSLCAKSDKICKTVDNLVLFIFKIKEKHPGRHFRRGSRAGRHKGEPV